MKTINTALVLASAAAPGAALASEPIYSNASAQPHVPALAAAASTGGGTPAPGGGSWSEVSGAGAFEANSLAGASGHAAANVDYRLADDVVVTGTSGWTIDEVWLYAYQPGYEGTASPFAGATLRIWSGVPGASGSWVVWGDAATDRLTSAAFTDVYRVFDTEAGPLATPSDTSRRVFRVTLNVDAYLPPGAYWLDWQVTSATPGAGVFFPTATIDGLRTRAGWNAVQATGGVWSPLMDAGKPEHAVDVAQDLPFILTGTVTTPCTDIDFNNDGLYPDNLDLQDFIAVFGGADCPGCDSIDFNGDGLFPDNEDIFAFFRVFGGGDC
ncbi:MAG TPA: hypothetical protein VD971_13490 [Phycisphaerales bacterium]|nr:hypothetical protein [Phycisphaerales bacterium]